MSSPLLLIVDGESIRTPGLDAALEADGWSVHWYRSGESPLASVLSSDAAVLPDLLLIDPSVAGGAGYAMARGLRERKPQLPVLALSDGPFPHPEAAESAVDIQVHLDRSQGAENLASWIHRFLPDDTKLTSVDIFGDLLEELERPRHGPGLAPDPHDPPGPAEAKVAPSAPQEPLSTAERFSPAPEAAEVAPSTSAPPVEPPVESLVEPAGAAAMSAEPLGPSDFTLSGISGVNDPFEWAAASAQPDSEPPPMPWPQPATPVSAPVSTPAIEEYGNYFLLEKIAVGGMAELFKAQQRGVQGFQKIVAIKRILPHFSDNEDFVTMFIDEAKLAAQLTHPNIVQIFDLGKSGSSYYIAMEYVNGRDLRTLLRKVREYGQPFPEQVAAFVVMKVAAALDYAHRKRGFDDRELKLVHRDISPQNVILSVEGAVKLVDFGIAKAASKASTTMAGALKGKLLYMSPEQATGQPLDNRSDLYSLGLVLFELLTGERCFHSDSELGVLEKVRLGRISDLTALNPKVSREMAAIVNKALQKSVDRRYPSARFIERDLREYLQRQGTPITEHDVAEYMNTLLRGSRETLDTLVTARFPLPSSLSSDRYRAVGDFSGSTVAARQGSLSFQETAVEAPVDQVPVMAPVARPNWLLPVILALAVILVIMLIVAGWS
jgi:serine/threonine protein kinase/CheY-like chemotaxis protein